MKAIVDGFNAPLTAGAFVDLSSKHFYEDLPINRAEEFFVLQTGDPIGEAIGYIAVSYTHLTLPTKAHV